MLCEGRNSLLRHSLLRRAHHPPARCQRRGPQGRTAPSPHKCKQPEVFCWSPKPFTLSLANTPNLCSPPAARLRCGIHVSALLLHRVRTEGRAVPWTARLPRWESGRSESGMNHLPKAKPERQGLAMSVFSLGSTDTCGIYQTEQGGRRASRCLTISPGCLIHMGFELRSLWVQRDPCWNPGTSASGVWFHESSIVDDNFFPLGSSLVASRCTLRAFAAGFLAGPGQFLDLAPGITCSLIDCLGV